MNAAGLHLIEDDLDADAGWLAAADDFDDELDAFLAAWSLETRSLLPSHWRGWTPPDRKETP